MKYATMEYTCDWCLSTEESEYGPRSYDKLPEGWTSIGGEDICPECREAFDDWKKARK